jgi:uncharacterized membrane protein YozB (DUF420 family)
MIKILLKQVLVHILIIIVYSIIGLVIPIALNFKLPAIFVFSWFLAPIISIVLSIFIIESLPIIIGKGYLIGAFMLNLVYLILYTWYESMKPVTAGDFMDFRGLALLIFGFGQVGGIIFTFLYFHLLKKTSRLQSRVKIKSNLK